MQDSIPTKRRAILVTGLVGMLFLGMGDVLLELFPDGGETFLSKIASTSMVEVSEAQYLASFVFGLVATIVFVPAAYTSIKILGETVGARCRKTMKTFTAGMIMMAVTMFAAHSVCCLDIMIIRRELIAGSSAAQIEQSLGKELILAFALTNIWITISEFMVSIAMIILIVKKALPVKRWMLLLNPICSYLIFKIAGSAISAISGNPLPGKLLSGGASWGFGLLFLMMLFL